MNILVMGGTGWVGHSIVKVCVGHGLPVTILTRGKRTEFLSELSGVSVIRADKANEADMQEVFKTRYTHVIDSVPTVESINLVAKYAKGLVHYIHCSSTGGYAPLPAIPGNETMPYKGFAKDTGWDEKRIVDSLVMDKFMNDGFPCTVLRPCYITGPGMLPLDNFGGRRKSFIPNIIAEKTIVLPNDGQALLQPIFVTELARAFYLAITHERSIGQIYNICLDHAVTLNKYIELTAQALGKTPHIEHMPFEKMLQVFPELNDDIVGFSFLATHMCFDISKARRDLEFNPTITPEEAIEVTARWAATK